MFLGFFCKLYNVMNNCVALLETLELIYIYICGIDEEFVLYLVLIWANKDTVFFFNILVSMTMQ